MTGADLCVNLATSVPVIFEPPCIRTLCYFFYIYIYVHAYNVGQVAQSV